MKKRIALLAVLLMLASFVTACGKDAATTTAAVSTSAGETTTTAVASTCTQIDKLKLGYPGLPPDFIQMVTPLAIELGYFAEECLEVEITSFESGVAAFRGMVAGEMDLGFSGTGSPVLAFAQYPEVVVIGSHGAHLDFQIIAVGDITKCEDLRGRKVATEGPGGLQHSIMEYYLSTCGLDIDKDVELIVAAPETFAAQFAQGAIESTTLHIDERIALQNEVGMPFNLIGNAWEFAPNFHYASYATVKPVLAAKRDQFVRFNKAVLRTGAWLQDPANRQEAIRLIAKIAEETEATIIEAYDSFGSQFPDTCAAALPLDSFQFVIDLQVQMGNLTASYPASDLVDLSVCADAETALGITPTNPPPAG
jgi:NitT/TauT family transport system substrate-binding protein